MTSFVPSSDYVDYLQQRDRHRATSLRWALAFLLAAPALAAVLIAPLNDWVAAGNPHHPVLAFWFNPLGWLWGHADGTASATAPPASFAVAYDFARANEGECNHSSADVDLGGFTCKGITQGFLNSYRTAVGVAATSVADLTEQDAKALYRFIWDNANCDRFKQPMDVVCMDSALNFGPRWTEFLDELAHEGIDPIDGDPVVAAKRFAALRMNYRHQRMNADPTQEAFRYGWLDRDQKILDYAKAFDTAKPTKAPQQTMFPLVGQSLATATMTSPYGTRSNPTGAGTEFHSGVDYAAPLGHPIVFPETARVDAVFTANEGGNCGAGVRLIPVSDPSLHMIFCHLTEGSHAHLQAGTEYAAGGLLGTIGTTGRVAGPHMHLGMKQNGDWINPQPYINQHLTQEGKHR